MYIIYNFAVLSFFCFQPISITCIKCFNRHNQFSSVTQLCLTLCNPLTAACQASLSITNSRSLLKCMSIKSVMPSNHLIFCHPLLLLPSIFPSIRVLSNESVLPIRWPQYWSFSISPSNEQLGLISFRMNWLDLHAVQGTLKSLLQHHSSKASILWHSAFFTIQLSHPYMTTGKTIALTRGTFVGKVMSLLFNMLSRLVITFLPKSKHLLISWLAVTICSDFGAPKSKVFATPWTPWTVACQAPPSMGFFRQEYWSELPGSPGDPDPGIKPRSPTLQADALTSEPPGES